MLFDIRLKRLFFLSKTCNILIMKKSTSCFLLAALSFGVSPLVYASALTIDTSDAPQNWKTAAWDVAPDAEQAVTVNTASGITGSPLVIDSAAFAKSLAVTSGATVFNISDGGVLTFADNAASTAVLTFANNTGASLNISGEGSVLNGGAFGNIQLNNSGKIGISAGGALTLQNGQSINATNANAVIDIDAGKLTGGMYGSYTANIRNGSEISSSGNREIVFMNSGASMTVDASTINSQRADGGWDNRTIFMVGAGGSTLTLQNGSLFRGSNYDFDDPSAVAINAIAGSGADFGNVNLSAGSANILQIFSGSAYTSNSFNLGMNSVWGSEGAARIEMQGAAASGGDPALVSKIAVKTMNVQGARFNVSSSGVETTGSNFVAEVLFKGDTESVFDAFNLNASRNMSYSESRAVVSGSNNVFSANTLNINQTEIAKGTFKVNDVDTEYDIPPSTGVAHFDIGGSDNAATFTDVYVGGTNSYSGAAEFNLTGSKNRVAARDINVRASVNEASTATGAVKISGNENTVLLSRNFQVGAATDVAAVKVAAASFEMGGSGNSLLFSDGEDMDSKFFNLNVGHANMTGGYASALISGDNNRVRARVTVSNSTVSGAFQSSFEVSGSGNDIRGWNAVHTVGANGGAGDAEFRMLGSGNSLAGVNLQIGGSEVAGSGASVFESSSSSSSAQNYLRFMNVFINNSTLEGSSGTSSLVLGGNTVLMRGQNYGTGDARMRVYVGVEAGSASGNSELIVRGKNNVIDGTLIYVGSDSMGDSSAVMRVEGSTHTISLNWNNNAAFRVSEGARLEFAADAGGFSSINVTGQVFFDGVLALDFSNIEISDSSGLYSVVLISSSNGNAEWAAFCDSLVQGGEASARLELTKQNAEDTLGFRYEDGALWADYHGTYVPEPSACAALFGALALFAAAWRRRAAKN